MTTTTTTARQRRIDALDALMALGLDYATAARFVARAERAAAWHAERAEQEQARQVAAALAADGLELAEIDAGPMALLCHPRPEGRN